MTCEQHENVGSYVLGAMSGDEHERFLEHLAGCEDCQRAVADLQMVVDTLPLAAAQVAPPPELKGRIMAVVRSEAELQAGAAVPDRQPRDARRRPWWRRSLSLRPLPIAAAAAVLIAIGVAGGVLLNGGQSTETVTAKVTLSATPNARASLQITDDEGRLRVRDWPASGRDQVYQAWLVRGHAKPASAGLFRVGGSGSATLAIPQRLKNGDQVLVTVERGGGSDQPTTMPIAAAAVPA
jgi:anti-sigma-K factor RskA